MRSIKKFFYIFALLFITVVASSICAYAVPALPPAAGIPPLPVGNLSDAFILNDLIEDTYFKAFDKCMPAGPVSMMELEEAVEKLNELSETWFYNLIAPDDSYRCVNYTISWVYSTRTYRIIYDLEPAYVEHLKTYISAPFKAPIEVDSWGFVYRSDGTFPYYQDPNDFTAPESGVETPRDYFTDEDDNDPVVEDDGSEKIVVDSGDTYNGTFIDLETNTFFDIVKDESMNIQSLVYSPGDKTYYFTTTDSHDTTYNYSYTYNITNTSITYIGATAEETKTYEFYYQLPDGRNSADLTNEDIEILALGYNAINYGKSATDTNIRSLYHFDADVEDSSYFSEDTSFTWNTGASITYLESNAFNGCLYLDELTHDFTLGLPSRIASHDFTLQFRYYQQHTDQTGFVNSISFGETAVLQFSGTQMRLVSGTAHEIPTGTWNEIALIRSNGTLYLYLNGVAIASRADSIVYGNTINFHFDSASACFKYLDELRVLNIAYYDDGASYTPTSVPFDSNAVLVLPDQPVPVADAYWDINSSGTNLISEFDFASGVQYHNTGYSYSTCVKNNQPCIGRTSSSSSNVTVSVEVYDGYTRVNGLKTSSSNDCIFAEYQSGFYALQGLVFPIRYSLEWDSVGATRDFYRENQYYVFSVVDVNGNIYSLKFRPTNPYSGYNGSTVATFDWGRLVFTQLFSQGTGNACAYAIVPNAGQSIDIVHVELVKGSSTDLSAEYVTVRYPDIDIKAQTIAVRSDIPVEGHQLGGVRPSIPYRGLVWFYVIDGRIRDTQIYTGYAWQSVDSRIWTGERWIPSSSYDIILMQDLFDVSDAEGVVVIVSDENFWKWFVEAWTSFRAELIDILNKIADGAPDHSETTNIYVDVNYDIDVDKNVTLKDVTSDSSGSLADILKYFWELVFKGAVDNSSQALTDFKDSFDDGPENSDSVFSIFTYESEELWQ